MRGFIKWVGGKSRFVKNLDLFPTDFNTYFEPFVGAGSVLLALKPKKAVISDINPELITAWRVVQCNVEGLISKLQEMSERYSEDFYYRVRGWDVSALSPIDVAARFIFLNKTCFNGLYRVNKRGQFNVSFGRAAKGMPNICDADNLRQIGEYLNENNVLIECRPYDWIGRSVIKNDLVYLDPPYIPDPGKTSFTSYTPHRFTLEDHESLVRFSEKLLKRNAKVAISNSYNENSVGLLDPSKWNVHKIHSSRSVSRAAASRGKVLELLATSW